MTLKIEEVDGNLYHEYGGQCQPQRVYIEVDCDTETMGADYDAEIGGGVPASVWHHRVIRYYLPSPCITDFGINKIMEAIKPMVEKLLETYSCDWDGSNHVGSYDEDLASDIEREIEDLAVNTPWPLIVMDAGDYFQDETNDMAKRVKDGQSTIEEIRAEIDAEDTTPAGDDMILTHIDSYIQEIQDLADES